MKKVVKGIIVFFTIALLISIVFVTRRYIIVDKILDSEYENTKSTNFSIEVKFSGKEDITITKKLEGLGFVMETENSEGDIISKSIYNEKDSKIYHIDLENKNIEIESKEVDSNSMFYASYFDKYLNKTCLDKLRYAVKWKISEDIIDGKNVYYIDEIENTEIWIDKESYQMVKSNSKEDDLNEKKYTFEKNSVTERDFELPENIDEYTIIEK